MEVTNTFDGGMKTDYSPLNQPQKTYTYCLNGINISDTGDIFALSNEKGTINRVTNFPTGFKIVGGVVLNTDLIVCLANPTGPYSQVGIIDTSFSYTRVAPSTNTNHDFGFIITKQVDCQARKLFTGDRILYFTDNNRPIGYLNLDNPPATIAGNVSLFPEITSPIVDFVSISESGGSLHSGVYQFLARYRTAELNSTSFGLVSNVIPIVNENRSVGRNAYDGAYPTDPLVVNKSINVSILNIDTDFPFLELVAIRYDGLANELKAEVLPLIAITGNTTINYTYTGDDSGSTYLTMDEVTSIPVIYTTAKCIEQKDGRLILSNLGSPTESFDFQSIANDIILKYRIEELEYADGYTGNPTLSFALATAPYILIEDSWNIYLKFTEQVDSTTALTLTNYDINYNPSNPSAHVIGPDYILTDQVETSNNIYTCIQAAGSGANPPTGTTADNTWWEYSSPYILNPTAAALDPDDSSIVILTMDITDVNQVIEDSFQITIANVQDFDTVETIVTTTETILLESPDEEVLTAYFNDYKNEERTFNMKGYQREEIYSFGFGVLWTDGSRSLTYHIPGSDHTTAVTTAANTASKILGTYVSTADYPSGQNHLTGKVRHHKMPTLIQEPHFRVDASGKTYIRVLGIDFTNVVIPADIQPLVDRLFFVRQPRTNPTNRSILAQGMVNNMQRIATNFDYSNGNTDTSSRVYKKTPFFNNTTITETNPTSLLGAGDSAKFEFNTPEPTVAAFFSPETILLDKDISEFSKMKNVLRLTGNITRYFQPSVNSNSNSLVKRSYMLKHSVLAWLFGNYTNYAIPGVQTEMSIQEKRFIQPSDSRIFDEFFNDYPIDNSISGKFLCIKTDVTIPNANPNTLNLNIQMSSNIDTSVFDPQTEVNLDSLNGSNSIENNLYNIYKENNKQYGDLNASEYILIHSTTNVTVIDYNGVFGGDTFITRFAFGNKDNYQYRALYYTITTGVWNNNYPGNPSRYEDRIPGYQFKGMDLRTLSYYFVESMINTGYRHQFTGGAKYFPKDNIGDVLREDPRNGDATSYNTQYSFENSIQKFFSKPTVYSNVTRFETRSIYSEESREDDSIDNYRIFLPNSYYDLPKHTGEIWDTFVSNNTLYLHTPKSLWRSYFNDTVQQANDIGQTIMGTGGVFSLPSIEVITSKGGYAGTISQFAGVHTPYGYIFPDALQGKIFLLNQGLNEISIGNSRYFANNLGSGLVSGSTYLDNPSNPDSVGIIGVYDYDRKRYIITKRGDTDFTLSCSLLNPTDPTWISHHSYMPHLYFSINDNMFGFDNSNTVVMHEHNIGDYGVYYGAAVQAFILEYILNHNPNFEKAFDNIFIYSEAYNNNNFLELETFKSLQCTTTKKDTGVVVLSCTNLFNDNSNVKKKNDRFQLAVPRNSLGASNMFRDRMKGEWMRVRLSYPNTNNYKLLVNFINSDIRPVSR